MTILITGGSRGLGCALVEALAQDLDNQILFTYCHHEEEAQVLAGRFKNVRALQVDFFNEENVKSFAEGLEKLTLFEEVYKSYKHPPKKMNFLYYN